MNDPRKSRYEDEYFEEEDTLAAAEDDDWDSHVWNNLDDFYDNIYEGRPVEDGDPALGDPFRDNCDDDSEEPDEKRHEQDK